MATTRDKRLKTDSPTPVLQNETTTPTTPTAKTSSAIKLKRMSRNRSGLLSIKTENDDGNDSVGLSEDTQSSTSADNTSLPKTPNTRTKKQTGKDEKDEEVNIETKEPEDAAETPKDVEAPKARKLTKAQKRLIMKQKGVELALARRKSLMKRQSLPLPVKSSLRNIARRLSGKEEIPAKKGKIGRKIASEKEEDSKEEEFEAAADGEEEAEDEKPEVEEKLDKVVAEDVIAEVQIKQEKIDKNEKAAAAIAAIDLQNVRRSTRQRKSTIKDRDSPFTGRRSQVREKSESKRDSISPALSTPNIKAEKESSKAISITVEPSEATEKDVSLSPELVSEEMDTESVQHLYDKPDFLENNLGIEQDPKLGEIVKVQEKTKVEAIIKQDDVKLTDDNFESEEVKINGGKVQVENETIIVEVKEELKTEKREELAEESSEENKENKVESSSKSVGSVSPRSEDRLKTVSDENVPKVDHVDSELIKQKESHLLSLGLLTHKAADEAKLAKIKRKEEIAKAIASQPPPAGRGSKSKKESATEQYTGTLKTIIKLNRTEKDKRKTRVPLKMTFQKKNRDRDSNGSSNSSDSFYTIQEVRFCFLNLRGPSELTRNFFFAEGSGFRESRCDKS